ncbi:MAG TPA: hypothetical protein VLE97_02760 [Gaiellaceae bacterium]|nr:hypothetical protein [Gaiellaceae bacterium]
MDRAGWDKKAPLSGALFAILAAVGWFLLPAKMAPKASDSGDTYIAYITGHRDALLWRGYVVGIALLFFLWFIAAVAQRMRRLGEDRLAATMFGGGILLAGFALLQSSGITWVAWDHGAGLDGSNLKMFVNFGQFAFAFPWAVFVGAASISTLRTKMVPIWLSWYGIVLAVWILVAGASYAHSGFFSPTGWFGGLALIMFLIGTLLASVWMYMHPVGNES